SAAPVIDHAGRPIGVQSRSDIVMYDREKAEYLLPVPEYYEENELTTYSGENLPDGFQVEDLDRSTVRGIMTPVVVAVRPETPARRVVEEMLALKVHRMFVVGEDNVLVGVVSTLDVLRRLGAEERPTTVAVPGKRAAECQPLCYEPC